MKRTAYLVLESSEAVSFWM